MIELLKNTQEMTPLEMAEEITYLKKFIFLHYDNNNKKTSDLKFELGFRVDILEKALSNIMKTKSEEELDRREQRK